MRLYLRKAIVSLFVALFLVLLIRLLLNRNIFDKGTCIQSEIFLNDLHLLVARVHDVLSQLKVVDFLCYKALWGQIQQSKLFPWSKKAELCIKLDANTHLNETFVELFVKSNLQIQYSSAEGKYLISDIQKQGMVELIIFKDTKTLNMLHRVGWKHLLLPPNCEWESLDCFPIYLVEPPLSYGTLGNSIVPIPRGGIEIQKYHFRHTWWKKMERPC